MSRLKAVEQHNDRKLKQGRNDKFQQSDDYAGYRDRLLNKLTKIQLMWDGPLAQESTAKHRVKLTPENI